MELFEEIRREYRSGAGTIQGVAKKLKTHRRMVRQALSKEEFKREVEKHLTGKDTEPWELLYFKVYKSQLSVIEKALEIAGLMLGTNKSRGYCSEMICADFLAGASQDNNREAVLLSMNRMFAMLPGPMKVSFLERLQKAS